MSQSTWTLALDALPPEGQMIIVEQDGGGTSTALFLRIGIDTPPAGSIPLADGTHALAYLNVCTHMGCRLVRDRGRLRYCPAPDPEVIVGPCPCHGTSFDLLKNGLVVLGPATQNLPRMSLTTNSFGLKATMGNPDHDPHSENWPQEKRKE